MHISKVQHLVDEADALIDTLLSKIVRKYDEVPYIDRADVMRRAMEFLQAKKVPVTGYDIIMVEIVLESPDPKNEAKQFVPILETKTVHENEADLKKAIAQWRAEYDESPNTELIIKHNWTLDPAQIENGHDFAP